MSKRSIIAAFAVAAGMGVAGYFVAQEYVKGAVTPADNGGMTDTVNNNRTAPATAAYEQNALPLSKKFDQFLNVKDGGFQNPAWENLVDLGTALGSTADVQNLAVNFARGTRGSASDQMIALAGKGWDYKIGSLPAEKQKVIHGGMMKLMEATIANMSTLPGFDAALNNPKFAAAKTMFDALDQARLEVRGKPININEIKKTQGEVTPDNTQTASVDNADAAARAIGVKRIPTPVSRTDLNGKDTRLATNARYTKTQSANMETQVKAAYSAQARIAMVMMGDWYANKGVGQDYVQVWQLTADNIATSQNASLSERATRACDAGRSIEVVQSADKQYAWYQQAVEDPRMRRDFANALNTEGLSQKGLRETLQSVVDASYKIRQINAAACTNLGMMTPQ